jgi:hypothetical protein
MVAAGLLSRRSRRSSIAGAVVVVALALASQATGWFRVTPGALKAMRREMDQHPELAVAQTGWNAYSRIDAVEGFPKPSLARLYIDSDAWTNIQEWDGNIDSIRAMRDWYRALPFKFTPRAETLIIGPGGGPDVLAALAAGSKKVTAVELNPLMLQFVRHYGARAGNLYDRPDVEVIQSEGRNFISRTQRTFDIILLGFVDTWASVASGGLSLSENYLYTTQAFKAYYDHLADDGILVVIRWNTDIPRLVANSVSMLGGPEAAKRMVVLLEPSNKDRGDDPPQMLFMLRKRPFTADETKQIMTEWPVRPMIVPGYPISVGSPGVMPDYEGLLDGAKSLEAVERNFPYRIGPVFDDSPFYFATARPYGMATNIAEMLFHVLLYPVLILLALFALFGKPKGTPAMTYAGSLAYFSSLGFGFIAVELALLQNLTLLLGHPIFTLSVLLFTLLAAGGIGSAISRKLPIPVACLAVAVLGCVEAFGLPHLVPALLPLALPFRVAIAILLIAPLGLAMGVPFPKGLQHAGDALPPPPFFWGLNGIMSVIGSVATVFFALRWGFQIAMLIGCSCYMVAALASRVFQRRIIDVL